MANEILSNTLSNIIRSILWTGYSAESITFSKSKPSDIPFIRMGQISLYARKCNVPGVVFAHIYGKM